MKVIFALFFVIVLMIVSGCGSAEPVSATGEPCNLSALKIKDVKIEGDKDGFVSRAIKSELYKRGARVDQGGVEVVGTVIWNGSTGSPSSLSIEVVSMSMASTSRNYNQLMDVVTASERIAKGVAEDFCESSAVTPPLPTEK